MNDTPLRLAELLRRHGLHLKKSLGQNFLADPVHLDRIVAAAELSRADVVIEVGPGVGTLTARLASQAGRVVAVELDASLLPALRDTLAGHDNVAIVQGDILQLDPGQLPMVDGQLPMVDGQLPMVDGQLPMDNGQLSMVDGQLSMVDEQLPMVDGQLPMVDGQLPMVDGQLSMVDGQLPMVDDALTAEALTIDHCPLSIDHYKVVANLPYYITSAAIRHLLTAAPRPDLIVLTIQREVAQRIVARPPEMSLLAVSVQYFARPEIVARIPAGAFYPPPKVDSAILRLRPWQQPPVDAPDEEAFFAVARAGFGQRRKQLRNSLRANLNLSQELTDALLHQAGIDPQRRAETLELAEWARLAHAWRAVTGG
ncbi:MAG: 16S rRNA (adenine(1518)-N(6)/adenine(1519)-N(6))-dimethyltransferase [Anaerolinea sp.]|nr:16S rRNA (adenine(1518)-N(6)/adenine(1519)-N(6))-dimethyltransferase [Anaerolinea sp.]